MPQIKQHATYFKTFLATYVSIELVHMFISIHMVLHHTGRQTHGHSYDLYSLVIVFIILIPGHDIYVRASL